MNIYIKIIEQMWLVCGKSLNKFVEIPRNCMFWNKIILYFSFLHLVSPSSRKKEYFWISIFFSYTVSLVTSVSLCYLTSTSKGLLEFRLNLNSSSKILLFIWQQKRMYAFQKYHDSFGALIMQIVAWFLLDWFAWIINSRISLCKRL